MITFLLSFFSAFLLMCSFPKVFLSPLAWVGLVPLFWILDGKRPRSAFGWAFLTGVLFFVGTLYWFIYVTILGIPAVGAYLVVLLLAAYLALYFGGFGWFYARVSGEPFLVRLLLVPSAWVVLEYIRAHAFSGFGWVSLGQSQYRNLALIQIADVTGMYGVTWAIVMVNFLLTESGKYFLGRARIGREALLRGNVIGLAVVAMILGYGFLSLRQPAGKGILRVGVVQANIPQELKWNRELMPSIVQKHIKLTRQVAARKPEVIIWPETAFPGVASDAPELMEQVQSAVRSIRIPLLFGMVTKVDGAYYNSAVLLARDGHLMQQYNKLHLVPFGEFLPLRRQLPFLAALDPIEDFSPGSEYTLFPAHQDGTLSPDRPFNAVICFEDTLESLTRHFVARGSRLIVNITNDAWFEDTKAPYLHLASAVFRAVENRRSLVRAANTGVSCAVDPFGRILDYVQDGRSKKTYVSGFLVADVPFQDRLTFYTKFGDVFTYLCFACILMYAVSRFVLRTKRAKAG